MKNSFKFFFFVLIRKIKVRLNLPKQKNLVIFDNTSFEDLENILKARDYFILKVRVNEIEEIFLNLQIIIEIFKNFLRYKTEKQKTTNIFWSSYLVSLITLLKPKLVITHIDNSKKFSEISKILSKKLKFFTIQNAARYDQIIEKKKFKRNQ
jgi:surface carbohydrate biosynthesis protein